MSTGNLQNKAVFIALFRFTNWLKKTTDEYELKKNF